MVEAEVVPPGPETMGSCKLPVILWRLVIRLLTDDQISLNNPTAPLVLLDTFDGGEDEDGDVAVAVAVVNSDVSINGTEGCGDGSTTTEGR